jgi:hypothetical protein
MGSLNQPMPFPEVIVILDELLTSVQSVLGNHFIGMYLYGSLTTASFDYDSDIDYVVVTDEVISDDLFFKLEAMHGRIAKMDSWCATTLEGSYLPQQTLRQYDPIHALNVHIDRGRGERLHRMQIDNPLLSHAWWGGWVILRENLRERGITLAGPTPQTFIDTVLPEDLRQAMSALLLGWVAPLLDNPLEMNNRGYQSYTILTLCRILYTLHHGAVVSKPVAARWVQRTLGERWKSLIEKAWVGRHNPQLTTESDDVNGTMDMIRFTLEYSKQLISEGR